MKSHMFRFKCPTCGKRLKAVTDNIGKQARCTRCGDRFEIADTGAQWIGATNDRSSPSPIPNDVAVSCECGWASSATVAQGESVTCPSCSRVLVVSGRKTTNKATPTAKSSDRKETVRWQRSTSQSPAGDVDLGRFELRKVLGRGGFGHVFLVYDPQLDREAALKVPLEGTLKDAKAVERFYREAQAAAQLQHPNIVSVFEAGELPGGRRYIASAYVPGRSLREMTSKDSPWEPVEAARLVLALAEALHYAHSKGIIHRDVKPENVMVDEDNVPYVMDFGLARREETDELLTGEGAVMGTPAYMSPEQAKGQSRLADARSDLWSLGVVFFELLAGRRPFVGTPYEILLALREQQPPHVRDVNPSVPRDLEAIVRRCLQRETEDRYASCQHLADDVRRWLDGRPVEARPVSVLERTYRWCRRRPWAASSLAFAAFALTSFFTYRYTRPAYLDVRVTPNHADVTVDGRPVTLENGRALIEARPGFNTVNAQAEGYAPIEQRVLLARGRDNALIQQIELRSLYGRLHLQSNPLGAAVEVRDANDNLVAEGATPFHSDRLRAGKYNVYVSKHLFLNQSVEVEVPDGDRDVIAPEIVLEPASVGSISEQVVMQLRSKMEAPVTSDFIETPLRDVVDSIQALLGVHLFLNEQELAELGLDADLPVTLASNGLSCRATLALILRPLGLSYAPSEVTRRAVTLEIFSTDSTQNRFFAVSYDVRDLVAADDRSSSEAFIDRLKTNVAVESWSPRGNGRVSYLPDRRSLVVTQSWPVHEFVADYLQFLRKDVPNGGSVRPTDVHIADLTERLAADPNNVKLLIERGECWLEVVHVDKALSDFTKALTLEPGNQQALLQRADAYSRDKRFQEALRDCDVALSRDADSIDALLQRARVLDSMGQPKDAEQLLDRVVAAYPKNARGYRQRGSLRLIADRKAEAESDFAKYVELQPDSGEAWQLRGAARKAQGKLDAAESDFNRALELGYDFAYVDRAEVYYRKDRMWDVVKDCTRSIENQNELRFKNAYALRGSAYFRLGRLPEALADLTEAVRRDDKYLFPLMMRARVYAKMRAFEPARADYRSAAQLAPNDPEPFNEVAWIMATATDSSVRDGQAAVEAARKACELTQFGSWSYLDTLAAAYAEAGEFAQATHWQLKALQIAPASDAAAKNELNERLSLYRLRKPYRELPPTAEKIQTP